MNTAIPAWAQNTAGAEQGNQSKPNFIGKDGVYVMDLTEVKVITSDTDGVEYFIVEGEIVESTHAGVTPGTPRSHLIKMASKAAFADVQATALILIRAAYIRIKGEDPGPLDKSALADPALLVWLTGDEQPAAGIRLKVSVWSAPQKRDKTKKYTHVDFEAMEQGATLGLVPVAGAAPAAVPTTTPNPAAAPATPGLPASLLGKLGQ